MRHPIVAGNWKMHGSREENNALIGDIVEGIGSAWSGGVVVCPPYPYIWEISRALKDVGVALGAQNLSTERSGAYTGEVSGDMLRDVGCQYVIVGHSERRAHYREDSSLVARKYLAAMQAELWPILCVGETLDQREAGGTTEVVGQQLKAVLDLAGAGSLSTAVIAYEPVWAIGTGKTATPDQAQEVHAFIREMIASEDATIAGSVRLLYGGSVKAANAAELFAMPDVDGGLIGGASLKSEDFLKICEAAG